MPVGRCINRYAAGPEYFRYPRVVVAVDSEHHGSGNLDHPFMKDRIFIGYQEKAKAMEVISYNDSAGRFEFQTVSEYAENHIPRVKYAKRSQCMGAAISNEGSVITP